MWIFFALFSAVTLGFYDLLRKQALTANAVIPVLFLACFTGALFFTPLILLSGAGVIHQESFFFVPSVPWQQHFLFFVKSLLVGTSWMFGYYGLSHLPITVAIPIRATGPVWTLLGAMLLFSERYSLLQWFGIVTVILFFYFFSLAGKREGIVFHKNRWTMFMVIATLLGSASSLYDKHLLASYDRMALQAWFSVYQVPVVLIFLMLVWFPGRRANIPLRWTWGIPLIGLALVISDYFYFYALAIPGSLVAIVSLTRRSSVVLSFFTGAILFSEGNLKAKVLALSGIIAGLVMLVLGSVG